MNYFVYKFSKTMASIVRENLKIFSHTTSVKGIPKIFKATLMSSKVLWITATLSCLCVAGYNVYSLSASYLQHQTITTITEKQRNSIFPYQMTTLVCDNQPYKLKMIEKLGIPGPNEYFAKLREVLGNTGDKRHIKLIADELFSATGYRQYLTNEQLDMLIKQQQDLVISCQYLRRKGLFTQSIECTETNMAKFKTTVPGFFNCYVLESLLAASDMNIVGLELLLYVEVNKPASVISLAEDSHRIPLGNFQKIGVTILAIPYSTAQVSSEATFLAI